MLAYPGEDAVDVVETVLSLPLFPLPSVLHPAQLGELVGELGADMTSNKSLIAATQLLNRLGQPHQHCSPSDLLLPATKSLHAC